MHLPNPAGEHLTPAGSPFDLHRHLRPDGTEFWSARDLQPLMGYRRWENLSPALKRAMATARNQGLDVAGNFLRSQEVAGQRGPVREDYELSRLGAYLLAMNGDPNKPAVAAAQAYFAVRTRQAETAPAAPTLPQTYEEALVAHLDSVRARRIAEERAAALGQRAAELEPKAAVHDRFLAAQGGNRLVRHVAKELGWREHELRSFLLEERLIYQRNRPCGKAEYDFYADYREHFHASETMVRHRSRPGECAHYTLFIRPAGLSLIQARIDKRRTVRPIGRGWTTP